MLPLDLLDTAELLVNSSAGRPSDANLRRATSTSYYALFHALARCGADLLVGGTGSKRSKHAWQRVYRAIVHTKALEACKSTKVVSKFPQEVQDFANTFITMQSKRHEADYNPKPATKFTKSEVANDIQLVKTAINKFNRVNAKDKTAFCTFILFKSRD